MSKSSVLSERMFRLKHMFHPIELGNAQVGQVLICTKCDIVNYTPEQEAGKATDKSLSDWEDFHRGHGGEINNQGGGTMEFICSKCGSCYCVGDVTVVATADARCKS